MNRLTATSLFLPTPALAQTGASAVPGWSIGLLILIIVAGYAVGLRHLRRRAHESEPAITREGLSDTELDRYARHIVVHEIGGPGQMRLHRSRVLVIGAGGLGSPVLLYLGAAGIGTLGIVDDDVVDVSNLQRQIIHSDATLGLSKARSASAAVKALNPHVETVIHHQRLDATNALSLIAGYDLVIDGSDNFETRYAVNAACVQSKVPLIFGAITQWEGQMALLDPHAGGACYACVFPAPPASARSCSEAGVVSPVPGVIGTMMALEAIKRLTGVASDEPHLMHIFDGLSGRNRSIAMTPDSHCRICGNRPE